MNRYAFALRAGSFALMLALPAGLYLAAQAGAIVLVWVQLALLAAANLLLIRL